MRWRSVRRFGPLPPTIYTNREIAKALFVSEETIKTHVSAILRYFDAENRTQAVRAAVNYAYSTSA